MAIPPIETRLQNLERMSNPIAHLTTLIEGGALSWERVDAAFALGLKFGPSNQSDNFRGMSYWARISTCTKLLSVRSAHGFALQCATRLRPQWIEYGLPSDVGLPALQLAEQWFLNGAPAGEELNAASEAAESYAAELDSFEVLNPGSAFAVSAARAWAGVADTFQRSGVEDSYIGAAFVAENSLQAAADYAAEALWQTRLLIGFLVTPGE